MRWFVCPILFLFTLSGSSQVYQHHWWVGDNTVSAITVDEVNERVYVGGSFKTIGPNVPYGGEVDLVQGETMIGHARPNGEVYAVAAAADGGWYIGGSFSKVGGMARNRLARINPDGSVHPWAPTVGNYRVNALAVVGDTVFVGGSFTIMNGQERLHLGAVNATTGALLSFHPRMNSDVISLASANGRLFVGGDFSVVGPVLGGGVSRNRLAAFNVSTGSLLSWNPAPSNSVVDIIPSGDVIYICGNFSSVYGQERRGVAAVSFSGNTVLDWNVNSDGNVRAIYKWDDKIIASGPFTQIGGAPRDKLAALDITTGLATGWDPGLDAPAETFASLGDTLCMGGGFRIVQGLDRHRLAFFDLNDGQLLDLTVHAGDRVNDVAMQAGRLYAGGVFLSLGAILREGIAALDLVTGKALEWDAALAGGVSTIALYDNDLIVGGNITSIGGQPRTRLGRITFEGAVHPWAPVPNGSVNVIKVSGDTAFIGGAFHQFDGQPRGRLAAVNVNDGTLLGWDPNASQYVECMEIGLERVYIGGGFGNVGGLPRSHLAVLDKHTGGVITSFQTTGTTGTVFAMVLKDSVLYIGGGFSGPFGPGGLAQRRRSGALNAITGEVHPWNPSAGGNTDQHVRCLGISDSTVYAGGEFTIYGGSIRVHLASTHIETGVLLPWNIGTSTQYTDMSHVRTMTLGGPYLFIGGFFHNVGLIPNHIPSRGFAVFSIANTSVDDISGPLCPGDTIAITFNVQASFHAQNEFSVQLSSPTGSFASPVELISLPGPAGDTLIVVIPMDMSSGTGYRIRVNGSSPQVNGSSSQPFAIQSLLTWHADADGDGYGDPASVVFSCEQPSGHVDNALDCDDTLFGNEVGSECDDGDPVTVNDTWTEDCECIGDITTGVGPDTVGPTLMIYPVPVTNILFFSEPVFGHLLDTSGRRLARIDGTHELPVQELSPGMYVISSDDGTRTTFVKY